MYLYNISLCSNTLKYVSISNDFIYVIHNVYNQYIISQHFNKVIKNTLELKAYVY